jgi:glucan-binding YG repeat protein
MKVIKISSLLVLFVLTMLHGSNISNAQTSLPEKPLPCNMDEIEPNDTILTATSVCSNDSGLVYGEISQNEVDYYRENNYFDGSDFTIEFNNNNIEDIHLELFDESGNRVYGTATSIYPYGMTYYYKRLQKGSYYIKISRGSEPSTSELIKYSLKIKQKVYRTGWFNNTQYWEFWNDGIQYHGTQWINYKNQWFFLKDGARWQNGWIFLGAKWYYLQPDSGVMKTGWLLDNGKWYFLDKINGDMKTGWVLDGGKWYFQDKINGDMKIGWVLDRGKWYYLYNSGVMGTGWIFDGGSWYYLNPTGDMATGWILYNGKWYYLYSNGKMAKSTWVGKYRLGSDGAWIN